MPVIATRKGRRVERHGDVEVRALSGVRGEVVFTLSDRTMAKAKTKKLDRRCASDHSCP